MQSSERIFQTVLFFSRWLIAPFLIGLLGCLILFIYRFFADLFDLATQLPTMAWHDLVVGVLNLMDLVLMANLILIVVFSGYENFIRNLIAGEHPDWPPALIDVDFAALKQKLLGSIAVIAAVDALAWFFDLEEYSDTSKFVWVVGFPLMFVVSMLMIAIADRIGRDGTPRP